MISPARCAKLLNKNLRANRRDQRCRVGKMNFLRSLVQKFAGKPVDWDELEESLIRADLGVPMSLRIIESLQERAKTQTITSKEIQEVARDEIARVLPIAPPPLRPLPSVPK